MYVTFLGPMGWQVHRVVDRRANLVAAAIDEDHAERIAELLERHGLEDVPLERLEDHT